MRIVLFLAALLSAVWMPSACWADEEGEDEAMAIAHRYGMDDFGRVAALKFTFNVRRGTTTVSRSWLWNVESHKVSVATRENGKAFRHAYDPTLLSSGIPARNLQADRWFVNDSYWLLFPYHLMNDRNMEITLEDDEPFPIPPGHGDQLTVVYAENVGYTPGDVYELFFDGDHLIRQMVFRKGGAATPTLVATWEDHATLGPLLVSLRHKSADPSVEIWFSDVHARLKGSDKWLKAAVGS
jgi:hypothetical protein